MHKGQGLKKYVLDLYDISNSTALKAGMILSQNLQHGLGNISTHACEHSLLCHPQMKVKAKMKPAILSEAKWKS